MFLDFKKAFDCVDHGILLRKLSLYGISGRLLSLSDSFLSNCSQLVSIHNLKSNLFPIEIGVPQGSILALTLFLIYVNDILNTILYSKSSAYADDTAFMTKAGDIQTLEQLCNTDLWLMNRWCCDNRMVLNRNKSDFMMLRPSVRVPDSHLDLTVKNRKLRRVSKTRLLGFILNDSLSLDDHIDQVCSKLNKSLALFQNCGEFINRRAAFNFYYSFFFCHLIYGICISENLAPDYLLTRIFLLQKRAFRLIANVNHIHYHLIQTSDLQNIWFRPQIYKTSLKQNSTPWSSKLGLWAN